MEKLPRIHFSRTKEGGIEGGGKLMVVDKGRGGESIIKRERESEFVFGGYEFS